MAKQGVSITIADNGLGQQAPGQGQTEVVIGCATGGTVANFVPYTTSNPTTIQANSGNGPMPRLAATICTTTGNPVTCVSVPSTTPGVNTAVFTAAANTGTSVLTITGTPNDDYYLVVTILAGGTFGTQGVVVGISLDAGATNAYVVNMGTATTVTTASPFTTYTGLSLSFTVATTVLADVYYAVCTAPLWNDAGVQSALNAVVAIKSEVFQDVMIAGVSAAADATAFDGYMSTLSTTNRRFSRLLCQVRDAVWGGASSESESAWMTSIETAFGNNSTKRVAVCAGHYLFVDPFTQSQMRSGLIFGAAARDSAVLPSTDLGEVDLGGLPNVILPTTKFAFANGSFFFHDEDINPGLDAARFMASWQLIGFPGIYIMNSNLMAPPGSDFNWLQHGHVIDEAASFVYAYFTNALSRPVRVNPKTGFILAQDRAKLQQGCQAGLGTALVGQQSAIVVAVSPTDNILSTATLTVGIYIVPLAYIKSVNVNPLTLVNPALSLTFQALVA